MVNAPAELADGVDHPPGPRVQRYQVGAFIEMLVSSILGLIASLVLSIDAIKLADDPLSDLSCNISDKISCATVGLSEQANLLGFPNAFLGLMTEPVVITIAVAALGGVRFPRWFMCSAQVVLLDRAGLRVLAVLRGVLRDRRPVPVVPAHHRDHHPGVRLDDPHQHPRGQPR